MSVAALSSAPRVALPIVKAVTAPTVKVVQVINGVTKSTTLQKAPVPVQTSGAATPGTAASPLALTMAFVSYDHNGSTTVADINPGDGAMSSITVKAHLVKGFSYAVASTYLYGYATTGQAPAASLTLKSPTDTKPTTLNLKSGSFTAKETGDYTFTWALSNGGRFDGAFSATLKGTEPPLPRTSGSASIDALLEGDVCWWHDAGTTPVAGSNYVQPNVLGLSEQSARHQLSYSFTTTSQAPSDILKNDFPGYGKTKQFAEMGANQKAAVKAALAYISSVTNLRFTEATDGSGNIQLGAYNMNPQAGGLMGLDGISNLPGSYPSATPASDKVYTFINASADSSDYLGDYTPGTVGWSDIWHELGHALGLKHPGNYDASTTAIPSGPFLPSGTDNHQYSVMSYKSNTFSAGANNLSYMPYDVAALQYLYGVNTSGSTAAGDVAGTGGQFSFSDTQNVLSTLYSATGKDTINLAGLTKGSVVNLNPGTYSSINIQSAGSRVYSGNQNVAVAYGSKINKVNLSTAVAADTVVLNSAFKQGAFNEINNLQSVDRIALSRALFGSLTAKNLDIGTTGAARSKDSRIVVNQSSGDIYYDADGSGTGYAAIKIAAYHAVAGAAVSSSTFSFVA